eukprot:360419-Chlamydomonas_euryale.AAC.1
MPDAREVSAAAAAAAASWCVPAAVAVAAAGHPACIPKLTSGTGWQMPRVLARLSTRPAAARSTRDCARYFLGRRLGRASSVHAALHCIAIACCSIFNTPSSAAVRARRLRVRLRAGRAAARAALRAAGRTRGGTNESACAAGRGVRARHAAQARCSPMPSSVPLRQAARRATGAGNAPRRWRATWPPAVCLPLKATCRRWALVRLDPAAGGDGPRIKQFGVERGARG